MAVPVQNEAGSSVDELTELALDLHWSWHHATDELFRRLDSDLWDHTHNPWVVLQTVSRDTLQKLMADAQFCGQVSSLVAARRAEADAPAWFQQSFPKTALGRVAYFSMEYMLSEALPIYSGGLGNVAGDQLKAASDLGVPVLGVGLLYQQGYFRQIIDRNGEQQALFPYNDPGQLPVTPVRSPGGEWIRIEVQLPAGPAWFRAWQARVGRTTLYLLDSNDPANYPAYRGITSDLYGGGPEQRIQQEIALGIGGWRLLETLGFEPDVCHLNEGHAALSALERARSFMASAGVPFRAALAATRAGNLFTTHTAVAAGFDRFPPELVKQYLAAYAERNLQIPINDLLALGRVNANDAAEPFNMAYLAIRCSGAISAVSALHERISKALFLPLFPRWPRCEIPIQHVTNGIHTPAWDSAAADELWTRAAGRERWRSPPHTLEREIRRVPDAEIWSMRCAAGIALVDFARKRAAQQLASRGAGPEQVAAVQTWFEPAALTLGFARRFAAYKRPNLLLHDPDRLARLLTDSARPVQLFVAGKAHPADEEGQQLIQEWSRFLSRPEIVGRAVFLSDYDMLLTEKLVQGVDVWINTPRRPWEACGTSGMKTLVNGGLNLSELDGWWAEAYSPDVGWAIGDGKEHGADPAWDAREAEDVYWLLEEQVIPEFYDRSADGIPVAWVSRMRESMARLTPYYSASRAVRQYTQEHYVPMASAFRERAADNGSAARALFERQHSLAAQWGGVRFGELSVTRSSSTYRFEVQVYAGGLQPDDLRVELYGNPLDDGAPTLYPMDCLRPWPGTKGAYLFRGSAPASRPPADYTPRILPKLAGANTPLEEQHILWQK